MSLNRRQGAAIWFVTACLYVDVVKNPVDVIFLRKERLLDSPDRREVSALLLLDARQ